MKIPEDDLIAKSSPRGWDSGGSVVWTGYYATFQPPIKGLQHPEDTIKKRAMAYKMEHYMSRKNFHRTIDDIVVTNLYCGVGHGWDLIVCGTIMEHRDRKSEAQAEAEKLLKGKC